MNLPDLVWQVAYGRLAWGVLVAALVLGAWTWRRAPDHRLIAAVLVASVMAMWLPGAWSPAYWLALAFQWPSALGLMLAVLSLRNRWTGRTDAPAMPLHLAVPLVAAGSLLYLDCTGWIARGLYANGFGPVGAPLAGLLVAGLTTLGIATGRCRTHAVALLAAVTLFSVLRLPSGNLWDALLDPFVFLWAVATLGRRVPVPRVRLRLRLRRPAPVSVAIEPVTVI